MNSNTAKSIIKSALALIYYGIIFPESSLAAPEKKSIKAEVAWIADETARAWKKGLDIDAFVWRSIRDRYGCDTPQPLAHPPYVCNLSRAHTEKHRITRIEVLERKYGNELITEYIFNFEEVGEKLMEIRSKSLGKWGKESGPSAADSACNPTFRWPPNDAADPSSSDGIYITPIFLDGNCKTAVVQKIQLSTIRKD